MDWTFRPKTPRCYLLELPAELRDAIYEFALTSSKATVTFRLDPWQRDTYSQALQPPLTRVSRQLRQETLPVYYGSNTFVLHTEGSKCDDARQWLHSNERYLGLAKYVEIWVRYVSLINDRAGGQGALKVGMKRDVVNKCWEVEDRWGWVTVVRKPEGLERDGEWLVRELRELVGRDSSVMGLEPERFWGVLVRLRERYVKEKMS